VLIEVKGFRSDRRWYKRVRAERLKTLCSSRSFPSKQATDDILFFDLSRSFPQTRHATVEVGSQCRKFEWQFSLQTCSIKVPCASNMIVGEIIEIPVCNRTRTRTRLITADKEKYGSTKNETETKDNWR
jgi:hypothetical protein